MAQRGTPKKGREERRRAAARLVWDDDLTDQAIAAEVGVCRRTLAYWKTQADFRTLVAAERAAWCARAGYVEPRRPAFDGTPPPPPDSRLDAECRLFIAQHWGSRG